jgi:Phage integrase family
METIGASPRDDGPEGPHHRIPGLYKQCSHSAWNTCRCPWWGRYRGFRVSLGKWSGTPARRKAQARAVFARLQSAVNEGRFDPRGEKPAAAGRNTIFSDYLDQYIERHVVQDGLRSNSIYSALGIFRREFGTKTLGFLADTPLIFETWLKDTAERKHWANATYNRYYQLGRALFNKAIRWRLVEHNPFAAFGLKRKPARRKVRITPEQEQRLLDCCELLNRVRKGKPAKLNDEMAAAIRARAKAGEMQRDLASAYGISRALVCDVVNDRIWNGRPWRSCSVGDEMRRRVICAVDLGLRAGEMLLVQVKHVHYETWLIELPDYVTKAGIDQIAFAGTSRLQQVLEERRVLGPDAYIFGKENGRRVASFDRSWKRLFRLAGLPTGRKNGLVWHDLRHEYGSYLADKGAEIHELRDLMRHADIRTTAGYLTPHYERLRELAAQFSHRHDA